MTASTSTALPPASMAQPSKPTPRQRHLANLRKYPHPLPLVFSPKSSSSSSSTSFSTNTGTGTGTGTGLRPTIENPQCIGILDPVTRSVWVTDRRDMDILFQRGFFGKGDLSRSEASWRERRVDLLRGGDSLAAEQLREKRRKDRKQFKIDRAAAMLSAAREAEAVITSAQTYPQIQIHESEEVEDEDGLVDRPGSPTPSDATTTTTAVPVDLATLNAQTFLIRPARPDANRNRGRKAFRRRPQAPAPVPAPAPSPTPPPADATLLPSAGPTPVTLGDGDGVDEDSQVDLERLALAEEQDRLRQDDIEILVEEMEHLQLNLEEAWFLATAIGVLKIYDPTSDTFISPPHVLPFLLTPAIATNTNTNIHPTLLPDDPFLVSYVAYHHYRSIGWVVKPGVKFCVDWLLYRRGPVFSHSAFAILVIPVYAESEEKKASRHGETDWYEEKMSWKWMNTIMRVNALVQKTVILAYVTIPPLSSFPASLKLDGGALDPRKNDMASLLKRYSVKEVSLTRFSPARRRD